MGWRFALPVVLLAAAAQAQDSKPVYTWTDEQGVEHYTDDPNTIPRKAKARTTEGAHVNVVSSTASDARAGGQAGATGRGQATDVQAAAAQAQAAAAQAQAAAAQLQASASDSAEDRWRKRFRDARDKVRTLEDDIEVDRKKVEEVDGMPVNAGFTCPSGWGGAVYPPAAPYAVAGGGIVARGQPAPGLNVTAGVGSFWNQGWYWPSVVTTSCWYGFNPDYERVRDQLARNRKALVRAKEELADLERRAALEAVPLEWRR